MNIRLLQKKVEESGLKREYLCARLYMTRPTLKRKLSGEAELTVSEMRNLIDAMRLTEREVKDIFFS